MSAAYLMASSRYHRIDGRFHRAFSCPPHAQHDVSRRRARGAAALERRHGADFAYAYPSAQASPLHGGCITDFSRVAVPMAGFTYDTFHDARPPAAARAADFDADSFMTFVGSKRMLAAARRLRDIS